MRNCWAPAVARRTPFAGTEKIRPRRCASDCEAGSRWDFPATLLCPGPERVCEEGFPPVAAIIPNSKGDPSRFLSRLPLEIIASCRVMESLTQLRNRCYCSILCRIVAWRVWITPASQASCRGFKSHRPLQNQDVRHEASRVRNGGLERHALPSPFLYLMHEPPKAKELCGPCA
jgi:hypothetical protein